MPGIKITDEDRKKIDRHFICTICNLLLCQPMQTHCGHLMCFACLQALLESSNPRCPEDNTELTKEQVFPDVFTKRELKGLRLHCTNQGCSWHGTYEQLEGHSQICEHALIKCVHSQCQVKFQRSDLGEHLKSECEYRNVKCDFCAKDVAFASLKEHVESICEGAPVTCKYCKENVLRKDVEKHERHDCNEFPVQCDFQAIGCNHDKTLKRKEVRQHLNDGLINHVWLLLQYILTFASQLSNYIPRPEFTGTMQKVRDDITEVRAGLAEKFVMIVGKITGLERRIESVESNGGGGDTRIKNEVHELKGKARDLATETAHFRETIMSLERQLREKSSIIERLHSRMDQMDESLALSTVEIRDDITDVRSGMFERYDVVVGKLTSLGRNIDMIIANLFGLERRIESLESITERLQSRMDQIDESLALNTVKITDLESQRAPRAQQIIHSYNGTLLWKIDNYQRKRQDAINEVKTALYSPPFYSAQYEYKMCAKIYMNGDGFGKGSHLSLFFVVMRGDFDRFQTWPFQKKITMMLLDQGNGDHMIDAFHSDPQSSSFQRPKSDMNIASGSPLFMPLDSLNNRQYIKDDVMFIKIIVD